MVFILLLLKKHKFLCNIVSSFWNNLKLIEELPSTVQGTFSFSEIFQCKHVVPSTDSFITWIELWFPLSGFPSTRKPTLLTPCNYCKNELPRKRSRRNNRNYTSVFLPQSGWLRSTCCVIRYSMILGNLRKHQSRKWQFKMPLLCLIYFNTWCWNFLYKNAISNKKQN